MRIPVPFANAGRGNGIGRRCRRHPRDGYTAFYTRTSQLFRDLTLARADGSLRSRLAKLAKVDVLVVDDWAMAPLSDLERRDFLEICEDRYQISLAGFDQPTAGGAVARPDR